MIWVSFFKPMGIFEGSFNRLAAWWTAGKYCHCELVFQVSPQDLMTSVKNVYKDLTEQNEDHRRLCAELEKIFFQNKQNKLLIQSEQDLYVSFSLIWGDQLRVRFLRNVNDTWCSSPLIEKEEIDWFKVEPKENKLETLEWALTQVTKPYNSSAAFFSWVPTFTSESLRDKDSYFCSEFTAMGLIKMKCLKQINTHHCTPNDLAKLLTITDGSTSNACHG